ncbi:hypothetical protein Tco_1284143 [Tanacetum coccineum]
MVEKNKLDKDLHGTPVDATLYYGMIGYPMYLTSNHAGCQDTRRSTSGSAQFLGDKLVSWSSKKQKSTVISIALDNALVAPEKRLKIEKCMRIEFSKPQRETTYQVTLDALKLSPCYPAFLITAEVPELLPKKQGSLRKLLHLKETVSVFEVRTAKDAKKALNLSRGYNCANRGGSHREHIPLKKVLIEKQAGHYMIQYSRDDDSNDDDNDDVSNDEDDDVESDADGDNEANDSEKTNSDEDENLNLNQNDDEEDDYEEEYVHTPKNYEFTNDEEAYEELYKDVNMRLKDAEHEKEWKGDA